MDSMKRNTMPIVPAIIMITFQSTAAATLATGRMPRITNSAAEPSAMWVRNFGKASSPA